jgi:hypothetical protein
MRHKRTGVLLRAALVATSLGAGAAWAQEEQYGEGSTDVVIVPMQEQAPVSGREARTGMEAANLRVGGGIEGLSGNLDSALTTGPMWGAALGIQPLSWLGAELSYSGSSHEVDSDFLPVDSDGAVAGADFLRHGGSAALTINAPTYGLQPYALVGVGIDSYSWRGEPSVAFRDDVSGRVPVGAGLRSELGAFVSDLRFNYNMLFDQDFAGVGSNGSTWDLGLQVGAQF